MDKRLWWQKPLRIIQYNLQLKDTPLMDVEKIVLETVEMHCNTIVINACGVAAWYPSSVPYEYVNEYMGGRDIMGELLEESHRHGLRVIGRFDFSRAEDSVYHQHPEWFCRDQNGNPVVTGGSQRDGAWRMLYDTCVNGGYQNEEVAMKLLEEIIDRYDFDGMFGGAGGYGKACWCDNCRIKYRDRYGKALPDSPDDFEPSWLVDTCAEQTQKFWNLCQRSAPDMAWIRYYFPFKLAMQGCKVELPGDNLEVRMQSANMLCTEAQDVVAAGINNLPEWTTPALRMKTGHMIDGIPWPSGIIHTSPGMDWRHCALPESEFMYWAAQIPAFQGNIWYSVTGFGDTNVDRRMLAYMGKLSGMIEKIDGDMDGAASHARVLLMLDNGGSYCHGWAHAMFAGHIDFDMLAYYQLSYERLCKYPVVIIPQNYPFSEGASEVFDRYVRQGGRLIVEGTSSMTLAPIQHLLGVQGNIVQSNSQVAAYLRLESETLRKKVGDTQLVPLRLRVGFTAAAENAEVWATWVPPFATINTAGAPPERASLPTAHTRVPLCILSDHAAGRVMFLPYEPSVLADQYGLKDLYTIMGAYVEEMLGEEQDITFTAPNRVITAVYTKDALLLVHLINGVGSRPLTETIPVSDIRFRWKLPHGAEVERVEAAISAQQVEWQVADGVLNVRIPTLETWDMIRVVQRPGKEA